MLRNPLGGIWVYLSNAFLRTHSMYVLIVSRNGVQTFLILDLSGGSECLERGAACWNLALLRGPIRFIMAATAASLLWASSHWGCHDCNALALVISYLWLFFECCHTKSLPQSYKLGSFIFINLVDKITERRLATHGRALSLQRVG